LNEFLYIKWIKHEFFTNYPSHTVYDRLSISQSTGLFHI